MKYDVIIVGAGPTGIFTAYELAQGNRKLKILLVDKGNQISKRRCPILEKKIAKCPPSSGRKEYSGCLPTCSITNGFGGAGAYSDGKFNITTEFGGWMTDYLDEDTVLNLIQYVDRVNIAYGASNELTDPYSEQVREIERKAAAVGIKLLRSRVRHLGTEENLKILSNLYSFLKDQIVMKFNVEIVSILTKNKDGEVYVTGVTDSLGTCYEADQVVVAPGRDGSQWFSKLLKKQGIKLINNQVDVGVRIETSNIIMEEINRYLYEGKFIFKSSTDQKVRSFCSNPGGFVVVENHSGVVTANGHAYRSKSLKSRNTNFALLVSHYFTEPFDKPNEYAREISRRANDLSGGSVIVQRFGDLKKGRRSTDKRLKEGFVDPTLKEAIPGDLGLVLPYNTMKSLIEMVEALNHVTPGISNDHTLFYGVEAKFYSARPELSMYFETPIHGLFAGGDGAGITRGLAQAGACGIWIARHILKRNEEQNDS